MIRVLILVGLLFMSGFLWIYFQPASRGHAWLFGLLTVSILTKLFQLLHEWYHYWKVVPPVRPAVTRTWTVDVMTTFCPGEPYEMIVDTLRAIQAITYPHTTYLCDEADDPYLRRVCADMGVRHVTRTDKKDAKAGNINNALLQATGEICLILDPDHVPVPDFLDQVLPYFEDPAIGFVQCVQAYSNRRESVVAYGAAEQTYSFYGPMMTCMSNYGTAQAIGANCTFRRAALDSIGGHAAGLSEDMHTAMKLHARGWASVYVPLPLSYGLVPATMSAYYKQQLKWARGTFELLVTTYPAVFGRLNGRQRLHYLTQPFYYLLGVVQLIDLLIPIIAMVTLRLPVRLELLVFATAYLPLLLTTFLIRQYAQRWLIERHEAGFHLVGGILSSGTWWIYVLGLVYTIFRVEVPYLPTPKNDKPRNNLWLCIPNIVLVLATLVAISYGILHYGRFAVSNFFFQLMIGFGLLNCLILGLNVLIGQERMLADIKAWIRQLTFTKPTVLTVRQVLWRIRYGFYSWLRLSAIPLFGAILLLTTGLITYTRKQQTLETPRDLQHAGTQAFYYGIEPTKQPRKTGGLIGPEAGGAWLIVPQHLTWPVASGATIAEPAWAGSAGELPLLYLEPALQPQSERGIQTFLRNLCRGRYNATLADFADKVKRHNKPVLLSVAPQYDDPARPWGTQQTATLAMYRESWKYVVDFFRRQQVSNVTWVWCPAKPATIAQFYPEAADLDWIGVPVVDQPDSLADPRGHSFATRYQLLHNMIRLHMEYDIRQKPILITQLKTTAGGSRKWATTAMEVIRERYTEIRGVVLSDPEQAGVLASGR